MNSMSVRGLIGACCLVAAGLSAQAAMANTIVEFNTSLGTFDVSLADEATRSPWRTS